MRDVVTSAKLSARCDGSVLLQVWLMYLWCWALFDHYDSVPSSTAA